MENTQLQGSIPAQLFSLPRLQSVILKNNKLNGTLDIGTNYGSEPQLIDLQNNSINSVQERRGYDEKLKLGNNPIFQNPNQGYCSQQPDSVTPPPPSNCPPCSSGQIARPNCSCSYPVAGVLNFISFTFSSWEKAIYSDFLAIKFMEAFKEAGRPVDFMSVSFQVPYANSYLEVKVEFFLTSQSRLSRTTYSMITSQLNNISFVNLILHYGAFYYVPLENPNFSENKSANTGLIIGAAVGGSVLLVLLLISGVYAFRLWKGTKRATKRAIQLTNPFALWNPGSTSSSRPQSSGVRCFTVEEIKKCANNFSYTNILGSGGYGPVYQGKLENGLLLAIKRAKQGSLQGSLEFKSEIELLSRVHNRNVVKLLGFCYELGEQMLVCEYIPKGTLKDSLSVT